jgi:hypothetical protein
MMVMSMTLGYLFLSKRMGDRFCIILGGVLAGLSYASLAHATELWHISCITAVFGTGCGFMFGCMMNLPNIYIVARYPKQIATCKSVYFMGSAFGSIAAAPVMVQVYINNTTQAWYLGGALFFAAAACMVVVERLIKGRLLLGEKDGEFSGGVKLTPEQHREFLASGAQSAPDFESSLTEGLMVQLRKNNYHLWNGRVQSIVREAVYQALPEIRDYDQEVDGGRGHLEDLAGIMGRLGMEAELAEFNRRHNLLQLRATAMVDDHVSVHCGHHGMFGPPSMGSSDIEMTQRHRAVSADNARPAGLLRARSLQAENLLTVATDDGEPQRL